MTDAEHIEPEYVDTRGASRLLSISENTLLAWRAAGQGPATVKIGRLVRYRVRDLRTFAEGNATSGRIGTAGKRAA